MGYDLHKDLVELLGDDLERIFNCGTNLFEKTRALGQTYPSAEVDGFEPSKVMNKAAQRIFEDIPNINYHHKTFGGGNERIDIFFPLDRFFDGDQIKPHLAEYEPEFREAKQFYETKNRKDLEETINVERLDDFIFDHDIHSIDLLGIETEGGTIQLLKGASYAMEKKVVKNIYSEVGFVEGNPLATCWSQLDDFLASKGYRLHRYYRSDPQNDNVNLEQGHVLYVS